MAMSAWSSDVCSSDLDPGTLNLTYNAVDLPVIRGHATDPAVLGPRPLDFAGLLELVGAVSGAFRSLGVEPRRVVGVAVSAPHIALGTFLATHRLGAGFLVGHPPCGDRVCKEG